MDHFFTDDSVMSLAICEALLASGPDSLDEQLRVILKEFEKKYPPKII